MKADVLQNSATWAVVATVDEAPILVQSFVAWHMSLGASKIYLYFDRPDDPSISLFSGFDEIETRACDAAHWARLGTSRRAKHQVRQAQNASDAFGMLEADWLVHLDADEYLWPDSTVTDAFNYAYPWTDGLILPVAERCFDTIPKGRSIFEGGFRRPDPTGRPIDGMPTLRGLTGHVIGKCFTRQGAPAQISIHRPKPDRSAESRDLNLEIAKGLSVLHYDGLTPLHWLCKLLRKADAFSHHDGLAPSTQRAAQIAVLDDGPAAALALYDALKQVDRASLAKGGLWLDARPDVLTAAQVIWPDRDLDVSPGAFDHWLWERYGALLLDFGLTR